jgi:O-antigen ligase
MIEITLCLILSIFVALRPTVIPYLALLYLFAVGLTSPEYMDRFTVTLGSAKVNFLDLLYVLATIFTLIYFVKNISNPQFNRSNSSGTKTTVLFVLLFVFFFIGKLINGFFDHLPFDKSVRLYITDTPVLYFFLPLVIYKDISQLKRLIHFTVILSLIFPLCQPFLIFSAGTQFILHGQGTFRLGYGDANVLLALGAIALFCWEHNKKFLTFLPLAGIMMLAHRSAFIAIALAFMAITFFKGKKVKNIALMGMAGLLVIGMLSVLGSFTNINILDKNLSRAEETFKATGTTVARAGVILIAIEELQKRPMTGFDYRELMDTIVKSKHSVRDSNIAHPHNFVLTALFNTGIIGTLILFILIYRSMRTSYKLAQTEQFKIEGAYLFSSILFFIIYSAMNTTMGSVGYVLWFLCGVTFLLFNQYKRVEQSL